MEKPILCLKIVIAGIGGRGTIFATRVIVEAAKEKGIPVKASETMGMSQRRGSVLSQIKLGEAESPLIAADTADVLLALDKEEGIKNLPFLKAGGLGIFNARNLQSDNKEFTVLLKEKGMKLFFVDADGMAAEVGYPMAANMVALGFLSAVSQGLIKDSSFVSREGRETTEKGLGLRDMVGRLSPEDYRQVNLAAFDAGEKLSRKAGSED